MSELVIAPDPHPEGPSSLPVEAPEDVRKELANDRQREVLRKTAVFKQLPRMTEVSPANKVIQAKWDAAVGLLAASVCINNTE